MSDLETAIRNAQKSGRLNHVSLIATWDGKWRASYRGAADDDHRSKEHSDAASALLMALTGRTIEDKPARKPARKPRPVVTQDDNDFEDLF